MSLQDQLPENWHLSRPSDDELCAGSYLHSYLDVEISVTRIEVENGVFQYSIMIQWAEDFGGAEDFFDLEGNIASEQEAKNWVIALMTQIENEFTPGDTRYVDRAMKAVRGESTEEPESEFFPDLPTCPVCDAPFFQFRGFDTYEQAQNHIEYMDDKTHNNMEVSLEEKPN